MISDLGFMIYDLLEVQVLLDQAPNLKSKISNHKSKILLVFHA